MSRVWLAGIALVLLVLAAVLYWLLPGYVLPPMDISQRPARHYDPAAAAPPVTSYVAIPLTLSVEKVQKLVLEQLSGKLLKEQLQIPDRDLQISIQRNGRVALWIHDAEMHLVYPIKFRTRGDLKTKGELTLFTRASFNISSDWQPLVDTRSTFRWDRQPKVGFWPFRFRIGDVLAPYIQLALDKGSDEFRDKASTVYNIRGIAESGWERLRGPHPLDERTWLTMQPREIYLEPITSDQSDVRLNLWMGGELGITEGPAPKATEALPLPLLRHGEPPAKAVVLSAPTVVRYERMLASLREALVGKPLGLSSGQAHVASIDMYSAGPEVAIELEIEGERTGGWLPVHGRVYYRGTPDYDPESGTLSIRELQPMPASRNPLAFPLRWVLPEAAAWAVDLEPRMRWDTTELVAEHQEHLDRHMSRTVNGRFDMWGDIHEVAVTGAVPQAEGIMLQALARGELELMFMP